MTDMADTPEQVTIEQATPQELAEMIAELEQYRERLVSDTLTMAQRAKIMKAQALATLEPSLTQIDANLEALRQRQASLNAGN
jgi:fatty acid-binding protein DegV